jgi:hypothetical protein
MSVINGTVRTLGQAVNRVAAATTAAAGAAGGAAVSGIIGGVTGAAEGVKRGISSGSHSTPAAALALGALGVAGLVEWPVLVAVGGGALLLQRLSRKQQPPTPIKPNLTPVPTVRAETTARPKPAGTKAAPRKTASRTPAKKAAGRRAGGATTLRSTN